MKKLIALYTFLCITCSAIAQTDSTTHNSNGSYDNTGTFQGGMPVIMQQRDSMYREGSIGTPDQSLQTEPGKTTREDTDDRMKKSNVQPATTPANKSKNKKAHTTHY